MHLRAFTFDELRGRHEAFESLLSDDERARAERFRFPDDRLRFILARGQLRDLLEGYTDTPAANVRFEYGPHGRPSLQREAGCPDVRFSVAHSATMVAFAFAFALDRNVGVDLEPLVSPDDALGRPEVYRRMLSPAELRQIEQSPPADRARLALASWVRKEACLKALGSGFSVPPDQLDVSSGHVVTLVRGLSAPGPPLDAPLWVEDFTVAGHLGAVAMVGNEPEAGLAARATKRQARRHVESLDISPVPGSPPRRCEAPRTARTLEAAGPPTEARVRRLQASIHRVERFLGWRLTSHLRVVVRAVRRAAHSHLTRSGF